MKLYFIVDCREYDEEIVEITYDRYGETKVGTRRNLTNPREVDAATAFRNGNIIRSKLFQYYDSPKAAKNAMTQYRKEDGWWADAARYYKIVEIDISACTPTLVEN